MTTTPQTGAAEVVLPEYVDGEPSICEPCGKPVYRGQLVQHWEDMGTVHADCSDPFSLTPNVIAEGGEVFVMLGSPMIYRPLTPTITPASQTDAILHDLIELEAPAEHLPEPMCERLLSLIDRAKAITAIQGEG